MFASLSKQENEKKVESNLNVEKRQNLNEKTTVKIQTRQIQKTSNKTDRKTELTPYEEFNRKKFEQKLKKNQEMELNSGNCEEFKLLKSHLRQMDNDSNIKNDIELNDNCVELKKEQPKFQETEKSEKNSTKNGSNKSNDQIKKAEIIQNEHKTKADETDKTQIMTKFNQNQYEQDEAIFRETLRQEIQKIEQKMNDKTCKKLSIDLNEIAPTQFTNNCIEDTSQDFQFQQNKLEFENTPILEEANLCSQNLETSNENQIK